MRVPFSAILGRFALAHVIAGLFLFCAASAQADQPWSIGSGLALKWGDQNFTPMGLRIDGQPDAVNQAAKDGFKSVCVDLPANGMGWSDTISAVQKNKLSFMIGVNSLAEMAQGYSIEPEGFRIVRFPEEGPIRVTIPGAQWVLAVLSSSRDGDVSKIQRVKTPNGEFEITLRKPADSTAVLLLYPFMQSPDLPDFFEGMDKHRDELLHSLGHMESSTGLRGIVNPLGTVVKLPSPEVQFVPSSPYFHFEYSHQLETKYRTLQTAEVSWGMQGPDIGSFLELSKLVPLWDRQRGIMQLWNPENDKLYPVSNRNSPVWDDIHNALISVARLRLRRLTDEIHSLVHVPVIQEWAGWSYPYEGGAFVDGVGIQTSGTMASQIWDGASRAASSVLRWQQPGCLIATRFDLTGAKPGDVGAALDDLIEVGARGVYARTDDPAVRKALVAAYAKYGNGIPADPIRAFYYPECVSFPANPVPLAGGVWWLPAPYSGNRLDLGTKIVGYRYNDGVQDRYVYWLPGSGSTLKTYLKVANPKELRVFSLDGTVIPTKISKKEGVEVTLSSQPILVDGSGEIPVPEESYVELTSHFAAMVVDAEARHIDAIQETYLFRNDDAGFDRSPGGAYADMYTEFLALQRKVSHTLWIEAEGSPEATLGSAMIASGCSANGALLMQTKLNAPGDPYSVEYRVTPRSLTDQAVWLAARIPESLRKGVRVLIGSQVFSLTEPPVMPYGLGYAWYHLGTTRLPDGPASIVFEVDGSNGIDLALDAFVLAPIPADGTPGFQPHGVDMPQPVPYIDPKAKPPKKKK